MAEEKLMQGVYPLDEDLDYLSHDELLEYAVKLRTAIRKHRDSQGHDLCWYHPELWALLPEGTTPQPDPPPWCEFMQKCAAYRASLEKKE